MGFCGGSSRNNVKCVGMIQLLGWRQKPKFGIIFWILEFYHKHSLISHPSTTFEFPPPPPHTLSRASLYCFSLFSYLFYFYFPLFSTLCCLSSTSHSHIFFNLSFLSPSKTFILVINSYMLSYFTPFQITWSNSFNAKLSPYHNISNN